MYSLLTPPVVPETKQASWLVSDSPQRRSAHEPLPPRPRAAVRPPPPPPPAPPRLGSAQIVILSRNNTHTRRWVNEDKVVASLRRAFPDERIVVYPDTGLPSDEMVRLFSRSRRVEGRPASRPLASWPLSLSSGLGRRAP